MDESGEGGDLLPTYKKAPTEVKIQGENPIPANAEYRKPEGKVLFQEGDIRIQAPKYTDFPTESGSHLQIVDQTITTDSLGETPLLSTKADPKAILRVSALGIAAEEMLVGQTSNVWANFNLHSRPPITSKEPIEAQYNPLTLDIHGRDIKDPRNWTRPPAIHGAWGVKAEVSSEEEMQRTRESQDKKGSIIPATAEEVEEHKSDPMKRVWGAIPDPSNPQAFEDWRKHPTGMYDWEAGRREYNDAELNQLETIFNSQEFKAKIAEVKNAELFIEENPEKQSFDPLPDSDIVLWEFGGYQLVTQKTPLVDQAEGIHMVLKLRPESHNPWNNPKQTLEALAIGIGVSRLLRDTKALGEIGDVYLDFNANWSMTGKGNLQDLPLDEIKRAIQKDTRTHLHIQLEKMEALWEIPPAPGTFTEHRLQSQEAIEEIIKVLNQDQNGLKDWIFKNCRGRIFN